VEGRGASPRKTTLPVGGSENLKKKKKKEGKNWGKAKFPAVASEARGRKRTERGQVLQEKSSRRGTGCLRGREKRAE